MSDEREERIRKRAHEIWEAEGRPEGRHDDHWQRAMAEVDGAAKVPGRVASGEAAEPAAAKVRSPGRTAKGSDGEAGAEASTAKAARKPSARGRGTTAATVDGGSADSQASSGRRRKAATEEAGAAPGAERAKRGGKGVTVG